MYIYIHTLMDKYMSLCTHIHTPYTHTHIYKLFHYCKYLSWCLNKLFLLKNIYPCCSFICWRHHMACGILVPQTGIELRHSAVTTCSATLNHQGIPKNSFFAWRRQLIDFCIMLKLIFVCHLLKFLLAFRDNWMRFCDVFLRFLSVSIYLYIHMYLM